MELLSPHASASPDALKCVGIVAGSVGKRYNAYANGSAIKNKTSNRLDTFMLKKLNEAMKLIESAQY